MTESKNEFDSIAEMLVLMHQDVERGKMMSSPGIKCGGKVFAFLCKDGMGFRLGPEFDPDGFGLKSHMPLSPFKTKPPLKGWFVVPDSENDRWYALSSEALAFTRTL
jgi:hypothetical protein